MRIFHEDPSSEGKADSCEQRDRGTDGMGGGMGKQDESNEFFTRLKRMRFFPYLTQTWEGKNS